MGALFNQWLQSLVDFELRRASGRPIQPWQDWKELSVRVDSLALEGLDFRAAAAALIELERGALLYEERQFDEALIIANSFQLPPLVRGTYAALATAHQLLLFGNVY